MSELREELAMWLADVSNRNGPDGEGWNMGSETTVAGWLYAADECLRQMEWARRPGMDALKIVQGADQHDGQYDGCSLCHYHKDQDPDDPKWGHYGRHSSDCPIGQALAAPLTLAPPEWRP